jgi:hypothetical protein
MHFDIFNDDAFSLVSLTTLINEVDHVPGRAGELAFAGVGEGVNTLTVSIEQVSEGLSLIPTTRRGAPAPREVMDKGTLRAVGIPQVKLEETIPASAIQDVRVLGSTDSLRGVQSTINTQMRKMSLRHDMTIEHLRLGALQGLVVDADGTELIDLFTFFDVAQETPVDMDTAFVSATDGSDEFRVKCQQIKRTIVRNLKAPAPSSLRIHAFCGDEFFDALVSSTAVKDVYRNWQASESRLAANYAHSVFEFGNIFWENYQGTDDNETVSIDPQEAMIFPVGVPGLYAEYFAPADFLETVNTVGLPRYAKIAPDNRFNRFVELHTQQNPLPICTRPRVLMSATISTGI